MRWPVIGARARLRHKTGTGNFSRSKSSQSHLEQLLGEPTGRVVGGLYGEQPSLERLSSDGNLGYALDFRSIYATVLERLWHVASAPALGGKFATVPFLPA